MAVGAARLDKCGATSRSRAGVRQSARFPTVFFRHLCWLRQRTDVLAILCYVSSSNYSVGSVSADD